MRFERTPALLSRSLGIASTTKTEFQARPRGPTWQPGAATIVFSTKRRSPGPTQPNVANPPIDTSPCDHYATWSAASCFRQRQPPTRPTSTRSAGSRRRCCQPRNPRKQKHEQARARVFFYAINHRATLNSKGNDPLIKPQSQLSC